MSDKSSSQSMTPSVAVTLYSMATDVLLSSLNRWRLLPKEAHAVFILSSKQKLITWYYQQYCSHSPTEHVKVNAQRVVELTLPASPPGKVQSTTSISFLLFVCVYIFIFIYKTHTQTTVVSSGGLAVVETRQLVSSGWVTPGIVKNAEDLSDIVETP